MVTVTRTSFGERYSIRALLTPTTLFVLAAAIILGACATNAALGHWAHQPNRDLFQHMAALRSLIENLQNPANPFVDSAEVSRHFHPYWVAMAVLARAFGWSVETTIGVAGFLSLGVLATGCFLFGRAYFRSEWGPLALLLCAVLAWSFPISHTGFINIPTLVEGAAYPAVLLVGLSLILWAVVIKSFAKPWLAIAVVAICALMFSTHQLGAGLGFVVALSLMLSWPGGSFARRAVLVGSMAAGIIASSFWFYFDPIDAVTRAGNPTWRRGVEWYTPKYLIGLFIPSTIGIVGLLRPVVPGTGRPFLIALPLLLGGFAAGAFGFLSGTRFAPTAILVLQIGLAAIFVRFFENPERHSDLFKMTAAGAVFGTLLFQLIALGFIYYPNEYREEKLYGDILRSASALTADVPNSQEVAAYDVAAWPLAASGQKVLSVPWPEPYISNLAERQRAIDQLFDVRLTREERRAIAERYGVRTLILDRRFGPKDRWRRWQIDRLASQSRQVTQAGPLWRFDVD